MGRFRDRRKRIKRRNKRGERKERRQRRMKKTFGKIADPLGLVRKGGPLGGIAGNVVAGVGDMVGIGDPLRAVMGGATGDIQGMEDQRNRKQGGGQQQPQQGGFLGGEGGQSPYGDLNQAFGAQMQMPPQMGGYGAPQMGGFGGQPQMPQLWGAGQPQMPPMMPQGGYLGGQPQMPQMPQAPQNGGFFGPQGQPVAPQQPQQGGYPPHPPRQGGGQGG